MRYFILTSKDHEQILCTKRIEETYGFITRYHDTQIRVVDHNAKPKLVSQLRYLKEFKRLTGGIDKFFQLCDIMITGDTNRNSFIRDMNLMSYYREYQRLERTLI